MQPNPAGILWVSSLIRHRAVAGAEELPHGGAPHCVRSASCAATAGQACGGCRKHAERGASVPKMGVRFPSPALPELSPDDAELGGRPGGQPGSLWRARRIGVPDWRAPGRSAVASQAQRCRWRARPSLPFLSGPSVACIERKTGDASRTRPSTLSVKPSDGAEPRRRAISCPAAGRFGPYLTLRRVSRRVSRNRRVAAPFVRRRSSRRARAQPPGRGCFIAGSISVTAATGSPARRT